jgi:hypothetical protein
MIFSFRNPQTLTHKNKRALPYSRYSYNGFFVMAILQGGLLNTSKKEGGLSESSRSSTGGLWLSGVMFLPCLPTDTQHLFL